MASISSTGHMILLDEFVKLDVSPEFLEMFLVVIQLGAILAVVLLFWKQIWPFGRKDNHNPVGKQGVLAWCKKDIWLLWFKIIAACLPAAVVGILFDEYFESLFYNSVCVALALIVFGVGFLIIENKNKGMRPNKFTGADHLPDSPYYRVVPVDCGNLSGNFPLRRNNPGGIADWRLKDGGGRVYFLFGDPRDVWGKLAENDEIRLFLYRNEVMILATGMLTAFLVSVLVIKFLMGYIKKHDFKVFGWYRIALGVLVLLYFGLAG